MGSEFSLDIDEARELVARADAEPSSVVQIATTLLEQSSPTWDRASAVTAWALGLALRHLRRLPEATRWLEQALATVDLGEDDHTAISLTLAGTFIFAANFADAERVLDRTRPQGALKSRVDFQRAGLAARRGDIDHAWAGFCAALDGFERNEDRLGEAHAHSELGQILLKRVHPDRAIPRFGLAGALYEELGLDMLVVLARHNLGLAASRAGYLGIAVDELEYVHTRLLAMGEPFTETALDRAEAMMLLGAPARAITITHEALRTLTAGTVDTDRAELLVALAQALATSGRSDLALTTLDLAASMFEDQDRPAWRDIVALREADITRARSPQAVLTLADRLRSHGFGNLAADADLLAVQVASDTGKALDTDALRRLASLPATDDRARAAEQAVAHSCQAHSEVIRCGVQIISATEREVQGTHRLQVRAGDLARRHRAVNQSRQAALAAGDPRALASIVLAVQRALLQPTNQAHRAGRSELADTATGHSITKWRSLLDAAGAEPAATPQVDHLIGPETLPDHCVVLLDDGDTLTATSRTGGTWQFVDIAPRDQVLATMRRHTTTLTEVMHNPNGPHRDALAASRAAMSALLPWLSRHPLNEVLTVLATGPLSAAPWASLVPAPVRTVVAPEHPARQGNVAAGVLAVHGPGLHSSRQEMLAVADNARHVRVLEDPTPSEVLAAAAVQTLHLCCHGHHDPESPLLSSYELHNARLTGFDIAGLANAPRTVVSAACRTGQTESPVNRVSLGLASAWLAAGADTVIAPSAPIPDDTRTAATMGALHAALANGFEAAQAVHVAGCAGDPFIASSLVAAGRIPHRADVRALS